MCATDRQTAMSSACPHRAVHNDVHFQVTYRYVKNYQITPNSYTQFMYGYVLLHLNCSKIAVTFC